MAKRAGVCLYLFGSIEVIGQVKLDLSEFTVMRLPLGKLPRMIGIFNPLVKKPLTDPLIEWGETVLGYRTFECPTVSSITELVKAKPVDVVIIHQPVNYNLSLLRQTILALLEEGVHVLLSGEATKRSLMALPIDIPIAAFESCEFADEDGGVCQRNALAKVAILRNLSKEFVLETFEVCLEFSRKFRMASVVTFLTRLKKSAEALDWIVPKAISRILEAVVGFKTDVSENRYLCRHHNPSQARMGKLTAIFGTSGALNRPITGSGKSEYLGKLARAYGTSVFTGLARESRAEIRGVQFVSVDGFDEIKNDGNLLLVDEFHTIRGDWRNFLEQALKTGKTIVVALPFSDADGATSERAAETTLLADEIYVHEATCWRCQSPAYRLTCWKIEAGYGRYNLQSSEIAALRTGHVRIKPDLKWDAVCLNHHPLIHSEPLVRADETREEDDFRKLRLRRRVNNLGQTIGVLAKWGTLLGLGIIVALYWTTLQPMATQTLDLALSALRVVSESVLAFAFFYVGLPLLVRNLLEATLLAYVMLRLLLEFWSDDRVSRRNAIPGFAIWTITVPPICGWLYLTLGTFALLIVLVGAVVLLFNLLSEMTGKIYGFKLRRRKKVGK